MTWHDMTWHDMTSDHNDTQCLLNWYIILFAVQNVILITCVFSGMESGSRVSMAALSQRGEDIVSRRNPPSHAFLSTTSHHITSHHITSHHITSHHITSNHIRSHHITSFRITFHFLRSCWHRWIHKKWRMQWLTLVVSLNYWLSFLPYIFNCK